MNEKEQHYKGVIAIDVDGTIVVENDGNFPYIESFIPKAKEYINKLYEDGFYIILWTCRHGETRLIAEGFLRRNGVKFHAINEHHPYLIEKYKNDTRKLAFDIVIDNRCLFDLPEWDEIYNLVHIKMESMKSILHD